MHTACMYLSEALSYYPAIITHPQAALASLV